MYKNRIRLITTFSAIVASAPVFAARYADALGDTAEVEGHRMDIVAVTVSDDSSLLSFHIEVGDNAGFAADTYARYMVTIDSVAGGNSTANAWHDKVSMPGMDFFGGGWTDAGSGAAINFYSSALGAWPEWQNGGVGTTWVAWAPAAIDGSGIQFAVELAALGLKPGDTFKFDVTVGWDGGTAVDAIGRNDGTATQLTGSAPYNSGTYVLSYTVGGNSGSTTWAGYEVIATNGNQYVNTESFLGFLEISQDPWIYCYRLNKYIFLPAAQISDSGAWGFVPNF